MIRVIRLVFGRRKQQQHAMVYESPAVAPSWFRLRKSKENRSERGLGRQAA